MIFFVSLLFFFGWLFSMLKTMKIGLVIIRNFCNDFRCSMRSQMKKGSHLSEIKIIFSTVLNKSKHNHPQRRAQWPAVSLEPPSVSYNGGRGSLVTVLHGRNPCLPDFWNSVESDVTSDDEDDALKAYVCHYSKVMENGIFIPDSMFTTYFPSRAII